MAIRREIIEFSQLPISSWLPSIDSVSAILFLIQRLSEAGETRRDGRCMPQAVQHLHVCRVVAGIQ